MPSSSVAGEMTQHLEGSLAGLSEASICKEFSAEPAHSKRSANGSDL